MLITSRVAEGDASIGGAIGDSVQLARSLHSERSTAEAANRKRSTTSKSGPGLARSYVSLDMKSRGTFIAGRYGVAPRGSSYHPYQNIMYSTDNTVASDCPLIPSAQRQPAERLAPGLTYKIAQSQDDLHQAFKLVYKSYRRAGLVDENPSEVRLTPFHLLPSTEVFITKLRDTVVSTVSLIGDGELGLPLESIYGTNVSLIRRRGLRMAEIGSLADRRDSPVRFVETFAAMGQLLAQVAMKRGYDGLVAAAHPKHARLYSRILPFEQIGHQVDCPYANGNPAVMLALVFDDHRGSQLYERFFGSLSSSTNTAPCPWSAETRAFFRHMLLQNNLQHERPIPGQIAASPNRRRQTPRNRFAD